MYNTIVDISWTSNQEFCVAKYQDSLVMLLVEAGSVMFLILLDTFLGTAGLSGWLKTAAARGGNAGGAACNNPIIKYQPAGASAVGGGGGWWWVMGLVSGMVYSQALLQLLLF